MSAFPKFASRWWISRDGGKTCIAWFETKDLAELWMLANRRLFPEFAVVDSEATER